MMMMMKNSRAFEPARREPCLQAAAMSDVPKAIFLLLWLQSFGFSLPSACRCSVCVCLSCCSRASSSRSSAHTDFTCSDSQSRVQQGLESSFPWKPEQSWVNESPISQPRVRARLTNGFAGCVPNLRLSCWLLSATRSLPEVSSGAFPDPRNESHRDYFVSPLFFRVLVATAALTMLLPDLSACGGQDSPEMPKVELKQRFSKLLVINNSSQPLN